MPSVPPEKSSKADEVPAKVTIPEELRAEIPTVSPAVTNLVLDARSRFEEVRTLIGRSIRQKSEYDFLMRTDVEKALTCPPATKNSSTILADLFYFKNSLSVGALPALHNFAINVQGEPWRLWWQSAALTSLLVRQPMKGLIALQDKIVSENKLSLTTTRAIAAWLSQAPEHIATLKEIFPDVFSLIPIEVHLRISTLKAIPKVLARELIEQADFYGRQIAERAGPGHLWPSTRGFCISAPALKTAETCEAALPLIEYLLEHPQKWQSRGHTAFDALKFPTRLSFYPPKLKELLTGYLDDPIARQDFLGFHNYFPKDCKFNTGVEIVESLTSLAEDLRPLALALERAGLDQSAEWFMYGSLSYGEVTIEYGPLRLMAAYLAQHDILNCEPRTVANDMLHFIREQDPALEVDQLQRLPLSSPLRELDRVVARFSWVVAERNIPFAQAAYEAFEIGLWPEQRQQVLKLRSPSPTDLGELAERCFHSPNTIRTFVESGYFEKWTQCASSAALAWSRATIAKLLQAGQTDSESKGPNSTSHERRAIAYTIDAIFGVIGKREWDVALLLFQETLADEAYRSHVTQLTSVHPLQEAAYHSAIFRRERNEVHAGKSSFTLRQPSAPSSSFNQRVLRRPADTQAILSSVSTIGAKLLARAACSLPILDGDHFLAKVMELIEEAGGGHHQASANDPLHPLVCELREFRLVSLAEDMSDVREVEALDQNSEAQPEVVDINHPFPGSPTPSTDLFDRFLSQCGFQDVSTEDARWARRVTTAINVIASPWGASDRIAPPATHRAEDLMAALSALSLQRAKDLTHRFVERIESLPPHRAELLRRLLALELPRLL